MKFSLNKLFKGNAKNKGVVSKSFGSLFNSWGGGFSPFNSFSQLFSFGALSSSQGQTLKQNVIDSIAAFIYSSPLYDAVDKITLELSSNISLVVYDKKREIYIKDHPVLELLKYPNSDKSGSEFLEGVASSFLITGNSFMLATGKYNKPPLEIMCIPPSYPNLTLGTDGFIENISMQAQYMPSYSFDRNEIDGRFKYYTHSFEQELYQIRKVHPLFLSGWGMSPVTPLFLELQQYIESGVHNLSLLQNGGKASGIFTFDKEYQQEDVDKVMFQIRSWYEGGRNAGKAIGLTGGAKFTEANMALRDMDFQQMRDSIKTSIYNIYKIPLPMTSVESMTLANLETSKLMLYDNAVIPVAKRICNELTLFLMHRFEKNWKDYEITYNPNEIDALKARRNEEIRIAKEIGVNSINEIRAMRGESPVINGDYVYQPAGLLPVGRTQDSEENMKSKESLAKERLLFSDKTPILKEKN